MATGDIGGKRLLLNNQVQYPGEGYVQEYSNSGDTSTSFIQVYNGNGSALHFKLKNGSVTAVSMYGNGTVAMPGRTLFGSPTDDSAYTALFRAPDNLPHTAAKFIAANQTQSLNVGWAGISATRTQ